MSDTSLLRLTREIRMVRENPEDFIYIAVQEDDITNVRAAIIGSEGTPYEHGIFEFQLKFKPDYPTSPPHVSALTTNSAKTRFNPNVYANGKVCLSILGTWRGEKGEEWSSAQGLESVLISIQSLLGPNPFENEPGFEVQKDTSSRQLAKQYVQKIRHETLRIAVAERLERLLGIMETSFILQDTWDPFQDLIKRHFLRHYLHYLEIIDREAVHAAPKQHFVKMPFEHASNTMSGEFNYPALKLRFQNIHKALEKETERWIVEGAAAHQRQNGIAANLKGQFSQCTQAYSSTLIDISLQDGNPFSWIIVYFGAPMSNLDGGVFRWTMVFNLQFPEALPRIRFTTPLFHVNLSGDGVPFYRVANESSAKAHIDAIINLLTNPPAVDPRTHLNHEAARLYWGSAEEQREYSKKFRRAVNRSIEYA